jgi:fructose-1,6-bisphosphatase-3
MIYYGWEQVCGNKACIANVIRICARYGNIRLLEDAYGINMRPLSIFALDTYKEIPPNRLLPRELDYNKYSESDKIVLAKIQKAIAVIQFKIEGQMIKAHPEYEMKERLLLDKINYANGTVNIEGIEYELNDTSFPTIDKSNPYELTEKEDELIERLSESFMESPKLNEHIRFIYEKGSTYKIFNSNLLMHACIPINEDGSYTKVTLLGETLEGKAYLDHLDKVIRKAYFEKNEEAMDYMWYLWCGKDSPFFGKDKMTTFEQYFVDDKSSHKENKIPYYKYISKEEFCKKILKDFGINEEFSHIINGHVPVKMSESPVKANGKLLVIDGGFAKGYREKTRRSRFYSFVQFIWTYVKCK